MLIYSTNKKKRNNVIIELRIVYTFVALLFLRDLWVNITSMT